MKYTTHLINEAYQQCLLYSTWHLIEKRSLDPRICNLVRDLWIMLANKMPFYFTYRVENGDLVSDYFDVAINEEDEEIRVSTECGQGVFFTATSDDDEDNEPQAKKQRFGNIQDSPVEKRINPIYTLVFIFFACSWLRLPVTLQDTLCWAQDGSIPYLSAHLHLPFYLQQALDDIPGSAIRHIFQPQSLPVYSTLRRVAWNMTRFYQTNYSIILPCIVNGPLIRHRIVKFLCLPDIFYVLACIITEICDGFSLPPKTLDKLKRNINRSDATQEIDLASIAAPIIAAMQLTYGLDGLVRNDDKSKFFIANLPEIKHLIEHLVRTRYATKGYGCWTFTYVLISRQGLANGLARR